MVYYPKEISYQWMAYLLSTSNGGDLHRANVGYTLKDNAPKIIDYESF
jgi:hypothetical protein